MEAQQGTLSSRLRPGENPRDRLEQHRERGIAAYRFTQADVAEAAGAPLSAVRRARQRGEIPSWTLRDVVPWVIREQARRLELPRDARKTS
ncbi:MAG: hypothetical protein E6Q97_20125 [Desulfurellales bacterium]|nr:MAG: hypothetical protein E6Q97_20125 [Desulfurellales bacterium]